MRPYRADRMVRALTRLVTIIYYAYLGLAVLALLAIPTVRLFASNSAVFINFVDVPVTTDTTAAALSLPWGKGFLKIEARGGVDIPLAGMPWWVLGIIWGAVALYLAAILAVLHQLRRIFQRVRAGAPFDAENAVRLRRVGLLCLLLALAEGVAGFITGLLIRNALENGGIEVVGGMRVEPTLVIAGVVLVALAEIFRRGSQLEAEQALVV